MTPPRVCQKLVQETRNCNTHHCPVNCVWKPFGAWGKCLGSAFDIHLCIEAKAREWPEWLATKVVTPNMVWFEKGIPTHDIYKFTVDLTSFERIPYRCGNWAMTPNGKFTLKTSASKCSFAIPDSCARAHACSELSLRILLWNASYVQKQSSCS